MIEREEKQAWDNIEQFQKRVAAQHKLQQQVLLKLIREVNEKEEQDKMEQAELEELVHMFGDTFKSFARQTEDKQGKQQQQQ